MNSKHINGVVSELIAAAYYTKSGHSVYLPIDGHGEYDMVVDDGIRLKRVQVKTIYWDNSKNRWLISFVTSHVRGNGRRVNKKYSLDSFDELLAVHVDSNTVYQIPVKDVAGKRSATVYPLDIKNGRYERYLVKL